MTTMLGRVTEMTGEQRVLTDQFIQHLEEALLEEEAKGASPADLPIIAAVGKAQHQLATEIEPGEGMSPGFLAGCTKNDVVTLLWEALGTKKGFLWWDKLGVPIPKVLAAARTVRKKLNVTAK